MQTMMQILEKKENTRGLQIHKHASVFFNNITEEYFKYQYNFGLNLGIFSLTRWAFRFDSCEELTDVSLPTWLSSYIDQT